MVEKGGGPAVGGVVGILYVGQVDVRPPSTFPNS